MNDEIKEIKIYKSNKSITFIKNNGTAFSQFGVAAEILDYITKLQKENERLTKSVVSYDETLLKKNNEYEDYKAIINKAIEYIKEKYIEDYSNNDNYIPLEKLNLKNCNWERSLQVLDMLQGSDKE